LVFYLCTSTSATVASLAYAPITLRPIALREGCPVRALGVTRMIENALLFFSERGCSKTPVHLCVMYSISASSSSSYLHFCCYQPRHIIAMRIDQGPCMATCWAASARDVLTPGETHADRERSHVKLHNYAWHVDFLTGDHQKFEIVSVRGRPNVSDKSKKPIPRQTQS
jgi:hypothetical protein